MRKTPPPLLQRPISQDDLPRTLKETYAEALACAEREYREAQQALARDDSDAARARYATALFDYDQIQAMFPFLAAGLGDAQA